MSEEAKSCLAKLTTQARFLTNFVRNTNKKGSDQLTEDSLRSRLELLETYWSDLRNAYEKILPYENSFEQESIFKDDLYTLWEDHYLSAKGDLRRRLNLLGAAKPPESGPSTTATIMHHPPSLPTLQLPRFDGTQTQWDSFKAQFTSRVIGLKHLAPVDKLQHLLSCLTREAARRVANIEEVNSVNFEVAWSILLKRYDHPRVRQSAHINRVLSLRPASQRSARELARILDETEEARRALAALGRPVDKQDDWFVECVVSRLDSQTREDWEASLESLDGFPSFELLSNFLNLRVRTLEAANHPGSRVSKPASAISNPVRSTRSLTAHHAAVSKSKFTPTCALCKATHALNACPTYIAAPVSQKRQYVTDFKLCFNCLRANHQASKCPSSGRCRSPGCGELHHTSLHPSSNTQDSQRNGVSQTSLSSHTTRVSETTRISSPTNTVLLMATAHVTVRSFAGRVLFATALIDPASEGSFIAQRMVTALGLTAHTSNVLIHGLGGQPVAHASSYASCILGTKDSPWQTPMTALVLPKLTSLIPKAECHQRDWPHLAGLHMANPEFLKPQRIDCILDADLYAALIRSGVQRGLPGDPVAQQTVFGWVLTGHITPVEQPQAVACHFTMTDNLHEQLQRFWELEEISHKVVLSEAEESCEAHYANTHARDGEGRYILRLPFSQTPNLPGSREIALSGLLHTERRLQSRPEMRQAYQKFMAEFVELGHMKQVPVEEENAKRAYYMPHHAVMKAGTSKIRIVFNASQKTTTGLSLNDCLHAGPKLQTDLTSIITRWRMFEIVFTTDIVKMFRQFRIASEDTDWLRILWRDSPEGTIKVFRMLTVVYGTACAPYQAIRSLRQLASDGQLSYPKGAKALQENAYVDDILAEAETLHEAREVQHQLINLLATAGMKLDKWSANRPELLNGLQDVTVTSRSIDLDPNTKVSTLGLRWCPSEDVLSYFVRPSKPNKVITKRYILSEVARLFDPQGWLAPIIICAKILIQRLWIKGKTWDEPVDDETLAAWQQIQQQLPQVEGIRIPRWLGWSTASTWFLHSFADASQHAYAAAVYLVCKTSDNSVSSSLLVAKTKVAPVKTISIPRLELCGALLLTRLLHSTLQTFEHRPKSVFCWSDSTVVLAWIGEHPSRWHTFVGNRVSEILTSLPEATWGHVSTHQNPADLASRGASPASLRSTPLWWSGPNWLTANWDQWVSSPWSNGKRNSQPFVGSYTSWFIYFAGRVNTQSSGQRRSCLKSCTELEFGQSEWYKWNFFPAERKHLEAGTPLPRNSGLRSLQPFLDAEGCMRVGGRLQHSLLSDDEKHPLLVPSQSHLAELLIREAHLKSLHGGPQLIASVLLRSVWIVHSRNKIRQLTRPCVTCTRFSGKQQQQQMAPLPSARVTPARPFHSTGLDYAGPFNLRATKGRGHKSYKGYVALFICMVTRAVHLEVVADYTTEGFLMAFKRFVARRGLCKTIWSDNGTNFKGACAELQRLFNASAGFVTDVANAIAQEGVTWNFIPPRAPHFGGLWEAGVRSFKHHLRRVMGDIHLTFEEFATLAAQIEACLNSRPLSSDPNDVAALTPGHFLIGTSLLAPPEPFDCPSDITGRTRYQLVCNLRNYFWARWHREVLQTYQQRCKWHESEEGLREGDLVLLTDELLAPTKCPMARVLKTHPGSDGLVRVLTLKTPSTTLQRPVTKVIKLPVDSPTRGTSTKHLPASSRRADREKSLPRRAEGR